MVDQWSSNNGFALIFASRRSFHHRGSFISYRRQPSALADPVVDLMLAIHEPWPQDPLPDATLLLASAIGASRSTCFHDHGIVASPQSLAALAATIFLSLLLSSSSRSAWAQPNPCVSILYSSVPLLRRVTATFGSQQLFCHLLFCHRVPQQPSHN